MENRLTPKELKDHELVKFHYELLSSYMKNTLMWEVKRRHKITRVYNKTINSENIRYYINRPIDLFLKALLLNKLDAIINYNPKGWQMQN